METGMSSRRMGHVAWVWTLIFFFPFFSRKDHAKCEFAVHDVFAVDILISTGDGKTKEKDTRTTVYKRTENNYQLKMKASRGLLSCLSIFFSWIGRINKCFLEACEFLRFSLLKGMLPIFLAAFYSEVCNKFTTMPFTLRYYRMFCFCDYHLIDAR